MASEMASCNQTLKKHNHKATFIFWAALCVLKSRSGDPDKGYESYRLMDALSYQT